MYIPSLRQFPDYITDDADNQTSDKLIENYINNTWKYIAFQVSRCNNHQE